MWSQLFDGSRCFLALETAGDAAAPGHHYGSTAATIFVWAALLVYAYRCFAESEDRRVLVYKWAASGGLILVMLLLFYLRARLSLFHPPDGYPQFRLGSQSGEHRPETADRHI